MITNTAIDEEIRRLEKSITDLQRVLTLRRRESEDCWPVLGPKQYQ